MGVEHLSNQDQFVRELHHMREEGMRKMTNEKALDILKTSLSPEQRRSLSVLLSRNKVSSVASKEKEHKEMAMALEAVNNLAKGKQEEHLDKSMRSFVGLTNNRNRVIAM